MKRTVVVSSLILVIAVCSPLLAQESDAKKLADAIDRHIDSRIAEEEVLAAPLADDAEFYRRLWLDIAGQIPPAADVQDFLADESPNKRARAIDELLSGPGYVMNFSRMWTSVLLPEANSNFQVRFLRPGFEGWVRDRLLEGISYDDLARELLTTQVSRGRQGAEAFYAAKEFKPESLAAATARTFLGVRIECAQCHDHPFDDWKQEDFWQFAAFFGGERAPNQGALSGLRAFFSGTTLTIPGTKTVVKPTFLNGEEAETGPGLRPKTVLANWVTSAENPYFARSGANRLWGHMLGTGIVEPVDDFSEGNPPSHPELLDLLADEFAAHRFDPKFLLRAIALSRTYQRSSITAGQESEPDPALFSRMAVKGLSAGQYFDSIAQATGVRNDFETSVAVGSARSAFIDSFGESHGGATERQKSVLQALTMMNGAAVTQATGLENSYTLRSIADYPLFDTPQRIQALFAATLGRKPRDAELRKFVEYVDKGGTGKDSRQALSDVFWVLLNSNEFSSNH